MQKSLSLEKINGSGVTSNARKDTFIFNSSKKPKRRYKSAVGDIYERYCITIKPKLCKSNSLSDLTEISSDYENTLDILQRSNILDKDFIDCGCSGDADINNYRRDLINQLYMSWNFKGKKSKRKTEMSPEMYQQTAPEFTKKYQIELATQDDLNNSSGFENSSGYSVDPGATKSFPFKSTPSGNLKVQSNQVVFQSSTVGVLLADPSQAKVKVKFEGNGADETAPNFDNDAKEANIKTRNKSRDLYSLGYTTAEPIDWSRVQLPKKQDLFQEFYRRIHNHVNTDLAVQIGNEVFHCHRMVLQIYSPFFDSKNQREIELPVTNVTADAFHAAYDWMILNGTESNRVLKMDNLLDVFCAAQFLSIKDLEDQCWSMIVNEDLFTEDTAFVLYRQARLRGLSPVMEMMIPRITRFFLPLVASTDFQSLELDELVTLFKSNYICVTSEIEVLMSGIRWLNSDWSARRGFATEVMKCVRFGLISPWQLVDIKRNRDNGEILEIVSDPDVQRMVDDGLAYVIIKYWYVNNSKNYYHWIDVLGLTEPAERNWVGEEKNHVTYKEFLKYLEQFVVPKDQMYQQMELMLPPRLSDDMQGHTNDKRRIDFPLPATLKGLAGDRDKFMQMNDFFGRSPDSSSPNRSPPGLEIPEDMQNLIRERRRSPPSDRYNQENVSSLKSVIKKGPMLEPPERDSAEEMGTLASDSTSGTGDSNSDGLHNYARHSNRKRDSVAACFLASAMAGKSDSQGPSQSRPPTQKTTLDVEAQAEEIHSPQISLFNGSKEIMAKANMNKLSTSILGPSNKNYMVDGSLFNWDRETVLVFGGIDPHTAYGSARNTGKDIHRFDPVTNVWENVGDLPEPRHHHSVAFLRGRVYLVGGADPRDDDIRGKSVVVSTVWSYEPVSRSWYSESGLAVPRKNFGLVVHKMALYAIGGQDKKGRVLRSVEKFDPKTGAWLEVKSMSVARMAVAAVKYREYIWVAGGMTGEKKRPVCKIVECYNSKTNEWTVIHSLRFPRCFSTLFAMNDRLYIIGGAGRVSEKEKTASSVGAIDVWDWKDREWKLETEMSIPRHGHALAYLGTQLIIIGGVTTIYMRALSNVESFCCERGAWIRGVATLPSPLSGHGAVTLPPACLM